MFVNLGDLRTTVLDLRAWESTGTTLNERLRRIFASAYQQALLDVPRAFLPDDEHVALLADVTSSDTGSATTYDGTRRYLQLTTDPWVMEFVDASGNAYANPPAATAWVPQTDGTWDGVMHLEITDLDGIVHRRQSREWWYAADQGAAVRRYYVSLDRQWPTAASGTLDFRIHQPEFFIRSDVVKVIEPIKIFDESQQQLWGIEASQAEANNWDDYRARYTGRPEWFWRSRAFQIPAPNKAPTVAAADQGTLWLGPENRGAFRFLYTRVWGRRYEEWQNSPGGTRDPVWESAPSPISTAYTHTANEALVITVPEIDWMQNFGAAADLRYSRTGYRTRIYVARDDITVGAPGAHPQVEEAGIFYLLGEVDGITTTLTWAGVTVPDYFRRLNPSTGYYGYKVYPHQDAQYTLDLKVLRSPDLLYNDADAPFLRADAQPALVELMLYYACLADGADQVGAAFHLANYQRLLPALRARYGNPQAVVEPRPISAYHVPTRLARTFEIV